MDISGIGSSNTQGINAYTSINNQNEKLENVGNTFNELLSSLSESQNNADALVSELAMGNDVDIHDVMIAVEENDVNFRIAIAIRDKLVDAYREITRMSV